MCIWMYVTPPLTKDSKLTEDKCILRTHVHESSACAPVQVPSGARCSETRHWPMLGSSGEITNRWLLVPLIPYTVKQALLEMSHSNMSILSPGLLKAERPLPPPHFALHFSFSSSPPCSFWQKKQAYNTHTHTHTHTHNWAPISEFHAQFAVILLKG